MAKITIEELSESLKEYLNGLGLTEAQIYKLINLWVDEKIGEVNNLGTEAKTIVTAINEVKDSIVNKDLSNYQTVEDNNLNTTNKNIVEAINEIYNSQDTVKQELVAALVTKGLEATTNMSFSDLLLSIQNSNLIKVEGTAIASDVLKGKTFVNSTGSTITGTMVNQGSKTITPANNDTTLPAGYYSKITVTGDSNLIASNIKKGVTLFGVTGTVPYEYVKTVNNATIYEDYTNKANKVDVGFPIDLSTSYVELVNPTIYNSSGNTVSKYTGTIKLTKNNQGFDFVDVDDGSTLRLVMNITTFDDNVLTINPSDNFNNYNPNFTIKIEKIKYYIYR